ncbi:MAG TPA: DUF1761 domain-containing protein [Bacteroidetes bacterium]|nr:DUF1761 domain-containing protein [Bacteroidota bacterium]
MKNLTINHGAVWVSVVLAFLLGYLWYGPLFGESWMKMVGLTMADVEANPPGAATWVSNIISSVVPIYVLAWLFTKMNVETALKGALTGLLISFAFNHLGGITGGMFAGSPYGLAWINGGFGMAVMAIAGAILGGWRKYAE